MVKVKFELTNDEFAKLDELREKLALPDLETVFNNAFTLLEWAFDQKKQGRIIASIDEANQKYIEIQMACLENRINDKTIETKK